MAPNKTEDEARRAEYGHESGSTHLKHRTGLRFNPAPKSLVIVPALLRLQFYLRLTKNTMCTLCLRGETYINIKKNMNPLR